MNRRTTKWKPVCQWCGKPLRRYRYRVGGKSQIDCVKPEEQWGDYGDNKFCGLNCGYAYGVWAWSCVSNTPREGIDRSDVARAAEEVTS